MARYHLVDRFSYVGMPWGILAFDFAVVLAILAASTPATRAQIPSGAVFSIYLFFLVLGFLSIFRSLPFGLALGVSRRSYYAGTILLACSLASVYGLALAVLQVIERATDGWGITVHFFRVAYIFDGPWYLTWLTSFVVLSLMFIYGTVLGVVFWRWNLIGLLVFVAAQITVVAAGLLVAGAADAWPAIGRFFATLSAAGLTGVLIVLALILFGGGLASMRHVTV
ncbi:MAG: ABC transporter permease [Candidatus Dormibacteria bacterium]